ncbi:MAG: hypothetical protein Q8Q09_27625 [Deltaproteobacteria bacterium]|nr:hypothetical protein [Deltaproteobacteria bacterium]
MNTQTRKDSRSRVEIVLGERASSEHVVAAWPRDVLRVRVQNTDGAVAIRALVDGVQVGAARVATDGEQSEGSCLEIPMSFVSPHRDGTVLVTELGHTRVFHGRIASDQEGIAWTPLAQVRVLSLQSQSIRVLGALAVSVLGGGAVLAMLFGETTSSRGRAIADLVTLVLSMIPLVFAVRSWRKPRPAAHVHGLVTLGSLLVVAGGLSYETRIFNPRVDGAMISGRLLPRGISRWLPFELAHQREALVREGLRLDPIGVEVSCSEPSLQVLSPSIFADRLRLSRPRAFREMSVALVRRLGLDPSRVCSADVSTETRCCVPMTPRVNESSFVADSSMRATQPSGVISRSMHHAPTTELLWRSGSSEIPALDDSDATLTIVSTDPSLHVARATRTFDSVRLQWNIEGESNTLALDGTGSFGSVPFSLELAAGRGTLTTACEHPSSTVFLLGNHSGRLSRVVLSGQTLTLGDRPQVFCLSSFPRAPLTELGYTLDELAIERLRGWSWFDPMVLPGAPERVAVTVERQGSPAVSSQLLCPANREGGPWVLRAVQFDDLAGARSVHFRPQGVLGELWWTGEVRSFGLFCVPAGLPHTWRLASLTSFLRRPQRVRDFAVTLANGSVVHAVLDTERTPWRLSRTSEPFLEGVRCCQDRAGEPVTPCAQYIALGYTHDPVPLEDARCDGVFLSATKELLAARNRERARAMRRHYRR